MKSQLTTALLAATLSTQANAFWGTAHIVIARIAQTILEQDAPNTLAAAVSELQILQRSDPSLTSDESSNSHAFSECASFADDIKGEGYSFQADWHFIDLPYSIDGTDLSNYDTSMENVNVHDAISALTWFLMDTGDWEASTYYRQIEEKFPDEDDARSFALRLVIHYVGDIHQPYHSVTGFSDHYDHGDNGGNYEALTDSTNCGATNLHAVWDAVMYEYCGRPNLPLNDSDWDWYTTQAQNLLDEYTFTSDEMREGMFYMWSAEAFDLTPSGYDTIPASGTGSLSDEYVQTNKELLLQKLAIGGRRLAALMQEIYPNDSNSAIY